jgi:hypothetical protein
MAIIESLGFMTSLLQRLDPPRAARWPVNARQTIATGLVFIVFATGLWLGWTGYRHGLPYIDEPDEMTIWTMGRAYFDPSWPMFQPHYPPGMLFVSSVVQRLQIVAGNPFYDEAGTAAVMRFLSASAYSLTLLLVMWLAYRFVSVPNDLWGVLAAMVAGCAWVLLPEVIGRAKLAVIDPWLWLGIISSVAAGLEGWRRQSGRWIALSLLLAMTAAVFKWQGAAVLAVSGLACLCFLPTDRKRALGYMFIYGIVVAAFAYWAIVIYGALEGDAYLPGSHTIHPTVAIVARNIQFQLFETGSPLVYALLPALALILPLFTPEARRRYYVEFPLWIFPIVLICYDVILSFNGAPVFSRQYMAANALQAVMAGIGVVLVFQTVQQLVIRYWPKKTAPIGRIGGVVVVGIALVIGLTGPWTSAFQTIYTANQYDLRPDTRNALAQWANTTATDGPLIVTNSDLVAALQTLYGYTGRQLQYPFNLGTAVVPDDSHIAQQMIDSGHIRYVITGPDYTGSGLTSPLTKLITYDNLIDKQLYRGESWSAYYVGQLPVLLSPAQTIIFNHEIALRGLSVYSSIACSGTRVTLQTLWSALHPPALNYSLYLHLFSASTGEKEASPSSTSLAGPARPTISWTKADEILIGDRFTAKISADLPPGQYQFWLGVFEPISGQRLHLPDGADHAVVGTITVEDCPASLFF